MSKFFVVELKPGCWIAAWAPEIRAAQRFESEHLASIALADARQHRPFINARIFESPDQIDELENQTLIVDGRVDRLAGRVDRVADGLAGRVDALEAKLDRAILASAELGTLAQQATEYAAKLEKRIEALEALVGVMADLAGVRLAGAQAELGS